MHTTYGWLLLAKPWLWPAMLAPTVLLVVRLSSIPLPAIAFWRRGMVFFLARL